MPANSQPMIDPQTLLRGFTALIQSIEWAAQIASGNASLPAQQDVMEHREQPSGGGGGYNGNSFFQSSSAPSDEFTDYDEETLADGRLIRRYATGIVRVENPTSGIMQEERPDGSLLISLPGGKVVYQHYKGEPLLVYDTSEGSNPGLAQVSAVSMPGVEGPTLMIHFQDNAGTHLIELENLRYYRLNKRA